MKEQGFTLIELLAVIVILAIIALIATPIVLNIIANTKENAQLRSAEMYLDAVEQSISMERMTNTTFKPNTCTITNEGNLYCDGYANIIDVQVNGEKPNNGRITFTEGKITQVELKYENGKTIAMNNDGDLEYNEETSEGSGSEAETLAAGLYDAEGNMTMSWQELIDNGTFSVTSGKLSSNYDMVNSSNSSSDVLIGKLIVDESVTSLDYGAFALCSNLREIILPNTLSGMLPFDAYNNCSNLVSITIPNSVTEIASGSIIRCSNLKEINYTGTQAEWNVIKLNECWIDLCPEITVHCTDGDIVIPANL